MLKKKKRVFKCFLKLSISKFWSLIFWSGNVFQSLGTYTAKALYCSCTVLNCMRQLVVNSLWKIWAGVLACKDELIPSDKHGLSYLNICILIEWS